MRDGIHPEDGLAHGPERTGEFVDVPVGRNVASLEVDLGHAAVVLADETHEDLGIDPARIVVEPAHDPEVERDDVAVRGDLEVSLVQVRVEVAVAERVEQEETQDAFAQRLAVVARRLDRLDVARREPLGPAERHHPSRGQEPVHCGNSEPFVLRGIGGEFRCARGFEPQVEFTHDHAFEMGDHIHRSEAAG